ncbi:alpha-tectorin-like [Ptychodera flava]|uniref:alpha-tectorin-like n=1 Tax=Ptychodera flava TaxID=63121 RepID=UPI003969F539
MLERKPYTIYLCGIHTCRQRNALKYISISCLLNMICLKLFVLAISVGSCVVHAFPNVASMDRDRRNGDQGQASAVVFGEPHFVTFDGFRYSYQAKPGCMITLVRDCRPESGHQPQLLVEAELERSPLSTENNTLTRIGTVFLFTHGNFIALEQKGKIQVNGNAKMKKEDLPQTYNNGAVRILSSLLGTGFSNFEDSEMLIYVLIDDNILIKYNGKFRLEITLLGNQYLGDNKLCGMFGNANGNKRDDFKKVDGTPLATNKQNADEFGDSWLISCPTI